MSMYSRLVSLGITGAVIGALPLVAGATATHVPTGPYVPGEQNQQQEQHINVTVGGASLHANNEGADIVVPGYGSVHANQNGADINLTSGGQSIKVSGMSNGSSSVSVANSVQTDADFSTFATNVQKEYPGITSIHSTATQVDVDYLQPAKLFGFIPVTLSAHTEASPDGKVSVSLPWYAFLTTSSKDSLELALKMIVAPIAAQTNGTFDPSAQAHIVAVIAAGAGN